GVRRDQAALQAVGGAERDGAHDAIAELLLDFQRDRRRGTFDLERVVHLRHVLAREFDVDDGADDLYDFALAHWNAPDDSLDLSQHGRSRTVGEWCGHGWPLPDSRDHGRSH